VKSTAGGCELNLLGQRQSRAGSAATRLAPLPGCKTFPAQSPGGRPPPKDPGDLRLPSGNPAGRTIQDVALPRDLPEHRLKRGDIVKPVEHHVAPDHTEGYSAEVFNALGDTLAVITVPDPALEPLREDEVLCAQVLAAA
jgi:hypothetical protein